jgi:hypothetical protein
LNLTNMLDPQLRASAITRRRAERSEQTGFSVCERRRRRRMPSAMREQLQ